MIRYFHPEDEAGFLASGTPFDDDVNSWWAGVQQCAAVIALAASVALASTSTAQAQAVFSQDEGLVAPLAVGQAEEELWNVNKAWPVPPLVLAVSDDDVVTQNLQSNDEDYWFRQIRVTQWASATGGGPFHLLEEEYWQNPVFPLPASNSLVGWTLQLYDQQEAIPAQPLVPGDEDFWNNPVSPVFGYVPPPTFLADDDIFLPATNALPPDEDLYRPQSELYDQWLWQIQIYLDDGSNPPAFQSDDDQNFSASLVLPVQQTFAALYLPDPDEIPAGQLFTATTFDEDFWVNPVPPVYAYPFRLFIDEDLVVPIPPLGPDEDFWQNPVPPVPASNVLFLVPYTLNPLLDEIVAIIPGIGKQGINPGVWNFPPQAITPGVVS